MTDIMFGWKTNTKAEVDQVLKNLKVSQGARILDLACGQGRHSIELARRGYLVTGLDYSPLLLSKAVTASKKLPQARRPNFVEGDMRKLAEHFPPGSFDVVINLWNAWGYFDKRSDDRKVLKGISQVLRPGGALVINTLNESGVAHRLKTATPRWHREGKGRYFLQDFSYDPRVKKLKANWILLAPKARIEKHYSFTQNVYSTEHFREELHKTGIKLETLWGLLEGTPYSKESWHQTFVARKLK
jgi:SAM-dependent methyltransferase